MKHHIQTSKEPVLFTMSDHTTQPDNEHCSLAEELFVQYSTTSVQWKQNILHVLETLVVYY